MDVKQLRAMQKAMPFQTLELRLEDGQILEVKQPEYLAISPTGHQAVVFVNNDSAHHFDVRSIVEVKTKRVTTHAKKK